MSKCLVDYSLLLTHYLFNCSTTFLAISDQHDCDLHLVADEVIAEIGEE